MALVTESISLHREYYKQLQQEMLNMPCPQPPSPPPAPPLSPVLHEYDDLSFESFDIPAKRIKLESTVV